MNFAFDSIAKENDEAKTQDEEFLSRRRSRRVMDKIMKQEELIERVTKILAETDKLYHNFTTAERDSVTVRDVVQLLEERLSWSLSKDEKKQVRGRLTELNTASVVLQQETTGFTEESRHDESENVQNEPDDVENDPVYDNGDSDYEDEKVPKKKTFNSRKRNRAKHVSTSPDIAERKKKKSKLNPKDFAIDNDTESKDGADEAFTSSRKKRKPAHLKIHLDMKKKREAKIREEEIASKKKENEKINEKDRLLAQLIARKFETDNEELRIQRTEDRLNLLERLEKRRWGVLRSSCEIDGLDVPLSLLSMQATKLVPTTDQGNKDITHEEEVSCSDDDSDDEELELVHSHGPASINLKAMTSAPTTHPAKSFSTIKQISPKSIMDFFVTQKQVQIKKVGNSRGKGNQSVSRTALIKMLRVKQFQAGNRWLARELGHEKPEDHIRDCMNAMKEKRNLILQQEGNRRSVAAERKLWMQEVLEEQEYESSKLVSSQNDNPQMRSLLSDEKNLDIADDENIDDDEFALARKLEREKEIVGDNDNESDQVGDDLDNSSVYSADECNYDVFSDGNVAEGTVNEDDKSLMPDKTQKSVESDSDDIVEDYTQEISQMGEKLVADHSQICNQKTPMGTNVPVLNNLVATQDHGSKNTMISSKEDDEEEREFDEILETKKETTSGVRKNAAWKALLLKEAEIARRQKKMRAVRDGLVEAEAEEEEEEEGIAGLEDFGFTIGAKKKLDDDEEENDEIMDDDYDNVVDELSDNEGDEDAGEKARKAFERKEDMERMKEIKRRVREGYDGRREGIAGGISSARGVHRFDQLVAAEGFEEAKRLGIQNDDESENEDGSEKGINESQGEIDDEAVLIDKAIKERHLKNQALPETFSDEEDNDDCDVSEDGSSKGENISDDEEDREQERLAKRFAKRARMNRLLDMYNSESQFSRSRLLDEDLKLRRDLKAIKNAHGKTSRDVSVGSLFKSVMSSSHFSVKRSISQSTRSTVSQQSSTFSASLGPKDALASSKPPLSLRLNNNNDRSKTSFLAKARFMSSISRSSSISK